MDVDKASGSDCAASDRVKARINESKKIFFMIVRIGMPDEIDKQSQFLRSRKIQHPYKFTFRELNLLQIRQSKLHPESHYRE